MIHSNFLKSRDSSLQHSARRRYLCRSDVCAWLSSGTVWDGITHMVPSLSTFVTSRSIVSSPDPISIVSSDGPLKSSKCRQRVFLLLKTEACVVFHFFHRFSVLLSPMTSTFIPAVSFISSVVLPFSLF